MNTTNDKNSVEYRRSVYRTGFWVTWCAFCCWCLVIIGLASLQPVNGQAPSQAVSGAHYESEPAVTIIHEGVREFPQVNMSEALVEAIAATIALLAIMELIESIEEGAADF
jgi:hypothetical protein